MTTLISAETANKIERAYGTDVLVQVAVDLSEVRRGKSLASFPEAHIGAKRTMRENRSVQSIVSLCQRGDDAIWLVKFGPRGGWSRIASF